MSQDTDQTLELLKRVKRIEIKAKRLSNEVFAGEYHSAFRGRGMAFSEVREYALGDDIRDIDWNVTARYAHPHVKVFEEERQLTVMLLIDMSGSQDFGTQSETKKQLATEIAATIAVSAIQNNDKIGAILFTDKVEKYIPPKGGRKHILYIIRELLGFKPQSSATDIAVPLTTLRKVIKKCCTAFLISDFETDVQSFEKALSVVAPKHDLVAIRVYDRHDEELPSMGLVQMKDMESGESIWIDTSRSSVRKAFSDYHIQQLEGRKKLFGKFNVDFLELHTGEDYVPALVQLFKKRS
ncbi:DUF58 domain-containing protein [Falsiporphyromonas endometrii]|uniref:DUF58 domain-containing protein n=1 Tax=Falsiporphyromonas endometrii TaxID=1387297 RepID=A0ABV9K9G6_9PORP